MLCSDLVNTDFFEIVTEQNIAGEKGWMPKNTAQSLKTAAKKILVLNDDNAVIDDVRSIDIDQRFAQFQNLFKANYNSSSLRVYESRAKKAIDQFVIWVNDPSAVNYKSSIRKPEKSDKRKASPTMADIPKENRKEQADAPDQVINMAANHGLSIPIPIRSGIVITIKGIPHDLTEKEAQKISAIIAGYAISDQ